MHSLISILSSNLPSLETLVFIFNTLLCKTFLQSSSNIPKLNKMQSYTFFCIQMVIICHLQILIAIENLFASSWPDISYLFTKNKMRFISNLLISINKKLKLVQIYKLNVYPAKMHLHVIFLSISFSSKILIYQNKISGFDVFSKQIIVLCIYTCATRIYVRQFNVHLYL